MKLRLTRLTMINACLALALGALAQPAPDRWEPAIRAFEEADKTNPPPAGGIVFVGSSSIVRWDVQASFPGLPVIKRGFGGSELADSVRYASRIVLPYRPETIVLYAGENDLWRGQSAERIRDDFQAFTALVFAALPETRIIYIPPKPGPTRWEKYPEFRRAGAFIRELCERDSRLTYLSVEESMLGADGKPRPELFVADGVHMSEAGYEIWTSLLKPLLARK